MSSPYKSAVDSPSRQLLWELNRLSIASQEEYYARLDDESREREAVHEKALSAAAALHTRVRENAESARRELELQIENERQRREDEQRREIRKLEQEQAERELSRQRGEAERLRQAQLHQQKIEQLRRAQEASRVQQEEKARREEITRQETKRKEVEAQKQASQAHEAELKAKEARISEQKSRLIPTQPPASTASAALSVPAAPSTQSSECEAEHQRYLAIHKNLKELRQYLLSESKKHDSLKQNVGEMRRQIRKSVGQLTTGQGANKIPLGNILDVFKRAIELSGSSPQVDVSLFLAKPPLAPSAGTQTSALLVYLLNVFAKAVVKQFTGEVSLDPKQADPIGTVGSHVFAVERHHWNSTSLIDILLAKLHVVCPVLFGIRGNEATNEGKIRLGWWREEKGGPFVTDQNHNDRMTGLGAGFAALSLRNYEKSKLTNPYPAVNYWRSFSYIVNIPSSERSGTHCVVLKAMIENYEERFMMFYGDAALVALRYAILEYPQGMKEGMGQRALAGLADTMRKEKKIRL